MYIDIFWPYSGMGIKTMKALSRQKGKKGGFLYSFRIDVLIFFIFRATTVAILRSMPAVRLFATCLR